MEMTITANDLKVKGVTLIDSVVKENDGAVITVHGKEKYIILKIEDYNRMRELELEAAILQSKSDIAAGRFYTDGIDAHMNRIEDV